MLGGVIKNDMFTFPFQVYPRESCLLAARNHRLRLADFCCSLRIQLSSHSTMADRKCQGIHLSKSEDEQTTCAL